MHKIIQVATVIALNSLLFSCVSPNTYHKNSTENKSERAQMEQLTAKNDTKDDSVFYRGKSPSNTISTGTNNPSLSPLKQESTKSQTKSTKTKHDLPNVDYTLPLQKQCPFRPTKIKKHFYVNYKKHRIYTCCKTCLEIVVKHPTLALDNIKKNGQRPYRMSEIMKNELPELKFERIKETK